MAARRLARRGGRSGVRNAPSWVGSIITAYTNVPAATKVLLAFFVPSTSAFDETILRTRGVMSVRSDQTVSVEEQIGAFGMIVVSDRAVAAGIASIPSPFTDADDDDWFVYEPFFHRHQANIGNGQSDTVIDSKAMRKFPEGRNVAVVVENGHATHGLDFGVQIRMLFKMTQV